MAFDKQILIIFLASYGTVASAQDQGPKLENPSEINIKKASGKIVLDGELSEKEWQESEVTSDFWMSFPVDDRIAPPEIQTEVRLTYDDHFIYLGIVCYDDDDYTIQTLKRDVNFVESDFFGVVIDPVHERTNGFFFGINPAGVQTELLISGQTGRRGSNQPGQQPRGINVA